MKSSLEKQGKKKKTNFESHGKASVLAWLVGNVTSSLENIIEIETANLEATGSLRFTYFISTVERT